MASKIDSKLVDSMIGQTVLAGITYCDADGNVEEQQQFFGEIFEINESEIRLRHPVSKMEFGLPPDFSGFTKADPGEYRLRSTGEVVVDPDLLATWTVSPPKGE